MVSAGQAARLGRCSPLVNCPRAGFFAALPRIIAKGWPPDHNHGFTQGNWGFAMIGKFTVPAWLFLFWNIAGAAAFVMQWGQDLDQLAVADPQSAAAFAAMPGWVWAAYAIAVAAGTLGAIAALMRRSVAVGLFSISLCAVVVQFGWTALGTQLLAQKGMGAAGLPLIIAAISVVEILWARHMAKIGQLR